MDRDQAREVLVGMRLVLGVAALLVPRLVGRVYGVSSRSNPALPFLSRLFGARELYMALPVLEGPHSPEARVAIADGVVVSALDAAAAVMGGARGYLPKRAAVMVLATATVAGGLGLLAQEQGKGTGERVVRLLDEAAAAAA